ncbi:hypothetical protein LFM09_06025 [Lentzea alba]|uniref:hypothetical protein n=1 Tax=Lentzea alba TaxID=2714351 RepID=UPI0039BF3B55
MEDLPASLSEHDLAAGLARFGITEPPTYVPVGFGDYHYAVADRWFTWDFDLSQRGGTGESRGTTT